MGQEESKPDGPKDTVVTAGHFGQKLLTWTDRAHCELHPHVCMFISSSYVISEIKFYLSKPSILCIVFLSAHHKKQVV